MFDSITVGLPVSYRRKDVFIPCEAMDVQEPAGQNTSPFFSMEYSESSQYTLDRFLEALRYSKFDDAMAYVSKNYTDRVDIAQICEAFDEERKLCTDYIVKSTFISHPKNCTARTFMTVDKNHKKMRVFNIYMLNEPDRYGKWKIYSIEQE